MKPIKRLFDTNAVLLLQDKLLDYNEVYISSTTLIELEHIKVSDRKDQETKYRARKILHILDENSTKYTTVVVNNSILKIIENHELENTPDNQICACAASLNNVIFVTNDIACKMIAKNVFGLQVESVNDMPLDDYHGYTEKILSDEDMAYGDTGKVLDDLERTKKIEEDTKQFILSHTKIIESEYDKNYRKNWWLDANEIIEKGVADHIITDIEELF